MCGRTEMKERWPGERREIREEVRGDAPMRGEVGGRRVLCMERGGERREEVRYETECQKKIGVACETVRGHVQCAGGSH